MRYSSRWLLQLLLGVALAIGTTANRCPAQDAHAVVLMYHRFGEDRYPSTSVRIDQFEAHLQHLEENNHPVWPLPQLVTHLAQGQPIPKNTVAITVDDAYLSVYTEAWPRLRQKGFPFTVFVATDPVDQGLKGYMSWDQLRELHAAGVTLANHSASHGYLVRRRPDETPQAWIIRVSGDIEAAQQRLEKKLGTVHRLFAYPFGEYDEALANRVRELGYTAFGQQSGTVGSHSDPRALPRFPMAEAYAEPAEFAAKVAMRALPVVAYTPWSPLLKEIQSPELVVTLAKSEIILEELACFVSGQGPTPVRWLDGERKRFSVQARQVLPEGRSRYNCTAPDKQRNFYWFSQPWIVPIDATKDRKR